MRSLYTLVAIVALLSGCSMTIPRYSIMAENFDRLVSVVVDPDTNSVHIAYLDKNNKLTEERFVAKSITINDHVLMNDETYGFEK